MEMTITEEDGALVVRLDEPRLDAAKAPGFKKDVSGLVARGHEVVILDFSEVTFVDSSGLSALIAIARCLGEGRLYLCSPQKYVLSLLRMTRLDRALEIHETIEQALSGSYAN